MNERSHRHRHRDTQFVVQYPFYLLYLVVVSQGDRLYNGCDGEDRAETAGAVLQSGVRRCKNCCAKKKNE